MTKFQKITLVMFCLWTFGMMVRQQYVVSDMQRTFQNQIDRLESSLRSEPMLYSTPSMNHSFGANLTLVPGRADEDSKISADAGDIIFDMRSGVNGGHDSRFIIVDKEGERHTIWPQQK